MNETSGRYRTQWAMRRRWIGSMLAGGIGLALMSGCIVQPPEPQSPARGNISNEEVLREFYASQLTLLLALDQAFETLGQEYYRLEAEYERLGRLELADITREKGALFHRQHLELREALRVIEAQYARLSRGEETRPLPFQGNDDNESTIMRGAATTEVNVPQGAAPPNLESHIIMGGSGAAPPPRRPQPQARPQVDPQTIPQGEAGGGQPARAPRPSEAEPPQSARPSEAQPPEARRPETPRSPIPTWTPVPQRTPIPTRPLAPTGPPR